MLLLTSVAVHTERTASSNLEIWGGDQGSEKLEEKDNSQGRSQGVTFTPMSANTSSYLSRSKGKEDHLTELCP